MLSPPRAPGSCAPVTCGASYAVIMTGELYCLIARGRQSVAPIVFDLSSNLHDRSAKPRPRDKRSFLNAMAKGGSTPRASLLDTVEGRRIYDARHASRWRHWGPYL